MKTNGCDIFSGEELDEAKSKADMTTITFQTTTPPIRSTKSTSLPPLRTTPPTVPPPTSSSTTTTAVPPENRSGRSTTTTKEPDPFEIPEFPDIPPSGNGKPGTTTINPGEESPDGPPGFPAISATGNERPDPRPSGPVGSPPGRIDPGRSVGGGGGPPARPAPSVGQTDPRDPKPNRGPVGHNPQPLDVTTTTVITTTTVVDLNPLVPLDNNETGVQAGPEGPPDPIHEPIPDPIIPQKPRTTLPPPPKYIKTTTPPLPRTVPTTTPPKKETPKSETDSSSDSVSIEDAENRRDQLRSLLIYLILILFGVGIILIVGAFAIYKGWCCKYDIQAKYEQYECCVGFCCKSEEEGESPQEVIQMDDIRRRSGDQTDNEALSDGNITDDDDSNDDEARHHTNSNRRRRRNGYGARRVSRRPDVVRGDVTQIYIVQAGSMCEPPPTYEQSQAHHSPEHSASNTMSSTRSGEGPQVENINQSSPSVSTVGPHVAQSDSLPSYEEVQREITLSADQLSQIQSQLGQGGSIPSRAIVRVVAPDTIRLTQTLSLPRYSERPEIPQEFRTPIHVPRSHHSPTNHRTRSHSRSNHSSPHSNRTSPHRTNHPDNSSGDDTSDAQTSHQRNSRTPPRPSRYHPRESSSNRQIRYTRTPPRSSRFDNSHQNSRNPPSRQRQYNSRSVGRTYQRNRSESPQRRRAESLGRAMGSTALQVFNPRGNDSRQERDHSRRPSRDSDSSSSDCIRNRSAPRTPRSRSRGNIQRNRVYGSHSPQTPNHVSGASNYDPSQSRDSGQSESGTVNANTPEEITRPNLSGDQASGVQDLRIQQSGAKNTPKPTPKPRPAPKPRAPLPPSMLNDNQVNVITNETTTLSSTPSANHANVIHVPSNNNSQSHHNAEIHSHPIQQSTSTSSILRGQRSHHRGMSSASEFSEMSQISFTSEESDRYSTDSLESVGPGVTIVHVDPSTINMPPPAHVTNIATVPAHRRLPSSQSNSSGSSAIHEIVGGSAGAAKRDSGPSSATDSQTDVRSSRSSQGSNSGPYSHLQAGQGQTSNRSTIAKPSDRFSRSSQGSNSSNSGPQSPGGAGTSSPQSGTGLPSRTSSGSGQSTGINSLREVQQRPPSISESNQPTGNSLLNRILVSNDTATTGNSLLRRLMPQNSTESNNSNESGREAKPHAKLASKISTDSQASQQSSVSVSSRISRQSSVSTGSVTDSPRNSEQNQNPFNGAQVGDDSNRTVVQVDPPGSASLNAQPDAVSVGNFSVQDRTSVSGYSTGYDAVTLTSVVYVTSEASLSDTGSIGGS